MSKVLIVYNTCGIGKNNTEWYIKCISRFLEQDFKDYRLVLSSCMNSEECIAQLKEVFGTKIDYYLYSEPYTVNITFNKTVQECIKYYGEFEGYLYVDSGCILPDSNSVLGDIYNTYKKQESGMLTIQTDTDTAFQVFGSEYTNNSDKPQITSKDFNVPLGKGINLHLLLFDNQLYKQYSKLIPDVFAAYCTESTFTFLCASIGKYWVIMKDLLVPHVKSIDGATMCVPHHSPKYGNHWNNLFCNRNAIDFIQDREAYECGLGYEECNNIMHHNRAAYDECEKALYPERLQDQIKKFFFLNNRELDYNKINYEQK